MTSTIKSAGFIVHDNNNTVHGYGETASDAWSDMERTMRNANVEILPDDADSTQCLGSWTREGNLTTVAASAALLRAAEDIGGNVTWKTVRGVACTPNEAEG